MDRLPFLLMTLTNRWATGLAGSHQNIQRRNSSVFFPATEADFQRRVWYQTVVNKPLLGKITPLCPQLGGSCISNATASGKHLVKPRCFRNLPIFALDLTATSVALCIQHPDEGKD